MAEIIPDLLKDINLQTQDIQQTPNKMSSTKITPQHIKNILIENEDTGKN